MAKIFRTYLEVVPDAERLAIVARIFAGMSRYGEKRATLKSILEAMGPFGIKAGQFLRSSGLLPVEYRMQLDDFFDNARPVSRGQMFARLREILGPNFKSIVSTGPIVGSGSINYVVLADIQDLATGKVHRVIVRILRDAVEGQVKNENAVWEKVIEALREDSDPAQRRAAGLLNEARAHSFENLRVDGSELNLSLDRSLYEKVFASYNKSAGPHQKIAITVVRPEESLHRLVPEAYQKSISILEYVPNQKFRDIEKVKRTEVAATIVRAELHALFTNGAFDPDGHPGNWLYDEALERLVRIDYGQYREIPPPELEQVRAIFRSLLRPASEAAMAEEMGRYLLFAFRFSETFPNAERDLSEAVSTVIADPSFPAFRSPHERLFFIQENFQRYIAEHVSATMEVHLQPNIQSALASLSRISIYRETISDRQFGKILLESIGINPYFHTMERFWENTKSTMVGIKQRVSCSDLLANLKKTGL